MVFHTFGEIGNAKMILVHGVMQPWQTWQDAIDHFSHSYYVIVPALDGHDGQDGAENEYISLDQQAEKIENWCIENVGNEISALCGTSMGGAVCAQIWLRGKLKIANLVLDGAPLVSSGKLATSIMSNQYISILRKSKKRDRKTLENFKKSFLPEKYLAPYLEFIDHMSEQSMRNITAAACLNRFPFTVPLGDMRLLFIHGTKPNDMLGKMSAKKVARHYPAAKIVTCKGCMHCEWALYDTQKWIATVEEFLGGADK